GDGLSDQGSSLNDVRGDGVGGRDTDSGAHGDSSCWADTGSARGGNRTHPSTIRAIWLGLAGEGEGQSGVTAEGLVVPPVGPGVDAGQGAEGGVEGDRVIGGETITVSGEGGQGGVADGASDVEGPLG